MDYLHNIKVLHNAYSNKVKEVEKLGLQVKRLKLQNQKLTGRLSDFNDRCERLVELLDYEKEGR